MLNVLQELYDAVEEVARRRMEGLLKTNGGGAGVSGKDHKIFHLSLKYLL